MPNYVTAARSNSILDQLSHLRALGAYQGGGVPDSAMQQALLFRNHSKYPSKRNQVAVEWNPLRTSTEVFRGAGDLEVIKKTRCVVSSSGLKIRKARNLLNDNNTPILSPSTMEG